VADPPGPRLRHRRSPWHGRPPGRPEVSLLTGTLTYAPADHPDEGSSGHDAASDGAEEAQPVPAPEAGHRPQPHTETPAPASPDTANSNPAAGSAAHGSRPGRGPETPAGAGTDPQPPRPVNPGKPLVQVLMPFTTLLGLDEQACELAGHGPIPAELAREIAADATLKRLVYDPLSGSLLDHGRTTYRPPAALADFVRARDVHCRGPICGRRALDSELDHIVPYPKGPTSEQNLMGGCGHDHHAKHAPGWRVRTRPGGRIEWITPTGHRYHSDPHDYRPDHAPPPELLPSQEQQSRIEPRDGQKAIPPDPLDPAPF
jgi:hypothetical protein